MTRPTSLIDMPLAARRGHLTTTPNPAARQDYMVVLEGAFAAGWTDHPVRAILRYVADRCVLSLDAYNAYLDALAGGRWPAYAPQDPAAVAYLTNAGTNAGN